MIIKFNLKKFLISIAIPLLVGGFSALITMGDMDIYKQINTPPLSPPSWLFPVVWTILYFLMGVSLYLVWNKQDIYLDKKKAYLLFCLQLFLNFIWSPVFFTARSFLLAFIILVLLIITVVFMIVEFYNIDKRAGLLQIPYLIWLLFAAYLNMAIYILNK